MPEFKNIKCFCSQCGKQTHHKVLFLKSVSSDDEEYFWACTYRVVECCGCDNISFLYENVDEADIDFDGNFISTYTTFPIREGTIQALTSWDIPYGIKTVYHEAVIAYNNSCFLLSAAGFRATIEAICIDKEIKGKNLENRINALYKKGIITLNDRDRLHSIRFLGNDSIHEMKMPDKHGLELVMKIVNNTLNNLYILDKECKDLENPIKTFEEFAKLLDEELKEHKSGEVTVLNNFLPKTRRLISDDKAKFENDLKARIKEGKYTKLELHSTPSGKPQLYKIP